MTTIDPAGGTPAPQPQKKKRGKKGDGLAAKRVNDLLKFLSYHHPDGLPDDGNGYGREALYDLVLLAMHLTKQRATKLAEIYKLAPWASEDERDDLEREALADPSWPSPDELGARHGVTRDERHGLEVWQLGAVDESPEERKAAEAAKQRKRSREGRLRRRAARAGEAAKPTARDRENRLLEELSLGPVRVPELAERLRHLPEFKTLRPRRVRQAELPLQGSQKKEVKRDVAGSVHKLADALKARGLIVDSFVPVEGRAWKVREIRRSTASEQRAAVAAAAATVSSTKNTEARSGSGEAAAYLEMLQAKLRTFTQQEDVSSLGDWFMSPEECAVRARCRFSPQQWSQARAMVNSRLHEIAGRKIYFGWSHPRSGPHAHSASCEPRSVQSNPSILAKNPQDGT